VQRNTKLVVFIICWGIGVQKPFIIECTSENKLCPSNNSFEPSRSLDFCIVHEGIIRFSFLPLFVPLLHIAVGHLLHATSLKDLET